MPYIKQENRTVMFDTDIKRVALGVRGVNDRATGKPTVDPGKLNYAITKLILEIGFKPSYAEYNAVIGALECCKLEMYRRALAPYENAKIVENGDVYPQESLLSSIVA